MFCPTSQVFLKETLSRVSPLHHWSQMRWKWTENACIIFIKVRSRICEFIDILASLTALKHENIGGGGAPPLRSPLNLSMQRSVDCKNNVYS